MNGVFDIPIHKTGHTVEIPIFRKPLQTFPTFLPNINIQQSDISTIQYIHTS